MNVKFANQLKSHVQSLYKNYLQEKVLDKDQINQIFEVKEVQTAFNQVIASFFDGAPYGKKYDNNILVALKNYEKVVLDNTGFNDEYLRQFLHIYRYFANITEHEIVNEKNTYVSEKETEYFKRLSYLCSEACENLYQDLRNNNRWWEVECATSLRRQFMNDRIVFPSAQIQRMCKRFLGRTINIKEELLVNAKKSEPPMKLVEELDKKMAEKGLVIYNVWVEIQNGKRVIVKSKDNPPKGVYYLKRYDYIKTDDKQK